MISSLSSLIHHLKHRADTRMRAVSLRGVLISVALCSPLALAEVPRIVTDIPATHSLVAMVMGDLGKPTLLLRGSASPHDYSLKPSEAKILSAADGIVWISADLTPWLPRALQSLSASADSIELLHSRGTLTLPFRSSTDFDEHAGNDEHQHGNTNEQQHDSEHGHGNTDPHAWLDPDNAGVWLKHIASLLAGLDENNRSIYLNNAAAARTRLENLTTELAERLEPVRQKPFMVFHDSYHYFETRFDIHAIGAISLGDGSQPGIRRLKEQRETLAKHDTTCVFTEPQFSDRLIKTVTEEAGVRMGQLDPVGALIEPGVDLYPQLLENLADSLVECLSSIH